MPLSPAYLQSRNILSTPLTEVRGVGPRLAEKLSKSGRRTVEDILYSLPVRYEDRRHIRKIAHIQTGTHEVFSGDILAAGEAVTSRARKKIYEIIVGDGSGQILLKWFRFRRNWMKQRFKVGQQVVVVGEIKRFGAIREVHHPEVEIVPVGQSLEAYMEEHPSLFGRVLPVYPLTEGLTQKMARKIGRQVVDMFAEYVCSPVPEDIYRKHDLLPVQEALVQSHWPVVPEGESVQTVVGPARSSLVFDEFFYLELGLALKRKGTVLEEGIAFNVRHKYTKPLADMLPYRLTSAQRRVLGEIKADMMAARPMNRLVQGDVGSGKTIVALMAALVAVENEAQVALVAPTEILAEQHFLQFRDYLGKLGLRTALLTGATPASERKALLGDIKTGAVHLVVGTHAVLQSDIEFRRLGLGIIDEQHRFGVVQRSTLRQKGSRPDTLVMTATPIPRTLALTLYGDLAVSVIDEMPPGRTPIQTRVLTESQRSRAYQFIDRQISEGRQAYIVYPLVEETEKSDLKAATEGAEHLREIFSDARLAVLHGRMKPDEKERIMRAFKDREIDILVSTTVIEVGIDVPNASVMMVEHAERFGLSQLHQLRGRVGRGAAESYCLLVRGVQCSADAQRRLDVMVETSDGFRIAEADLEIRGPGDFLGTRQAGLPDFRIADLLRDGRILELARQEAFALVEKEDFPDHPRFDDLSQELKERWGGRLELAGVG